MSMVKIMRDNANLCEEFATKMAQTPISLLDGAGSQMLLTAPWLLPGGDQNFALHSAAAGTAAATAVDEADGKKRKRKRGDKEKKVRDPLLPKRPPSAYLLYQNEVRKHMQEKFKELPYKEVLGEISKAWNAMTPEDKQMYQEATKVAKATYDDAKAEYDKAHGIEVKPRKSVASAATVAAAATPASAPAESDAEEEDGSEEEETTPVVVAKPKSKSKIVKKDSSSSDDSASSDEEDEVPVPPKKKQHKEEKVEKKKGKDKKGKA
ncbi:hypothetical protein EXIGLDRAFT_782683 [Exidia glandulosa HHB12029]|uniref:HMG box domain-containing protein n=1 Tax=Exidia glandulosa HHB12029 TaxID=1314781 RepID=A0A166NI65_EXIGL|nr:hypothetical protein EXIGLDRAFT_782683 [Exidia glandulosa HHB12029]